MAAIRARSPLRLTEADGDRAVANTIRHSRPAATERDKVMAMLHDLELHSPNWVKTIRAYIRRLEAQNKSR